MKWIIEPKSQYELSNHTDWMELNQAIKNIADQVNQTSTVQDAEGEANHIITLAAQEALSRPLLAGRIQEEAKKMAWTVIDIAKRRESTQIIKEIDKTIRGQLGMLPPRQWKEAHDRDPVAFSEANYNQIHTWYNDIHEQATVQARRLPHLAYHIITTASALTFPIMRQMHIDLGFRIESNPENEGRQE